MKALAFDLVLCVVIIGVLVAMPFVALARGVRAARAVRRDRCALEELRRDRRVLEELLRSIGGRP